MLKNKLLFVCLGNICRSPMAEGIMKYLIALENGSDKFMVDSAGTAAYHVGNSADPRMVATASKHGIDLTSRARQFGVSDFDAFDFIFVMDRSNYNNVVDLARSSEDIKKVIIMRDYDDVIYKGLDVPDPYYGGDAGFENVYQILYRSCANVLKNNFKIR